MKDMDEDRRLSPSELAMILACMEQVSIGDMRPKQIELQKRLAKQLRVSAPEQYANLVDKGIIKDWARESNPKTPTHKPSRNGLGVGDWMRFQCGDRVFRADDPRHVGRVESITNGACVRVRWDDNRICSHIPLADALNKKYCGRLIKVKQLLCGCMSDGSVICVAHMEGVR